MPRNVQIIRHHRVLRFSESQRGKTLKEPDQSLPQDNVRHEPTLQSDLEALAAYSISLSTERVHEQIRWRFMDGYHHKIILGFSSPIKIMAFRPARQLWAPPAETGFPESLHSALAEAEAWLQFPKEKHATNCFSFSRLSGTPTNPIEVEEVLLSK